MKIMIEGMMCQHCAMRVQKALEAAGAQAQIDLAGKCAVIASPVPVSEEILKQAVEKAGYTVTGIEND